VRKLEISSERPVQGPSTAFWGERLQLVREFRALTQKEMGAVLGVSHPLISDYEKGKRFPSPALLETISAKTGFLPEFFLRRIEDPFLESQCSFRHRRNTAGRLKDQVRAHATLLGVIVSSFKTMLRFPAFNVPSIPATTPSELEAAAEACRAHWGLDTNAPILQVGRVLEGAGVVIVPCTVDTTKIDAFSRYGKDNSLIFLNRGAGTRPSRWNFDLAHEGAHLVAHRDVPTGSLETEQAADRFASAFLLPAKSFGREFRTRTFRWQHVFELKQRWQVSAAAIVRRARDLDLLDDLAYRRAFQYMSFKKWRTIGEPYEPSFQEPELFTGAINTLASSRKKTLSELCKELNMSETVFTEITGVPVNETITQQATVLKFPARA
jgi:Zn-dependent peptidase ImmA (M78 family)/transcriptional regulator with XRE-family HTH domain